MANLCRKMNYLGGAVGNGVWGGGEAKVDNLRKANECQVNQFVEHQDENMPPKAMQLDKRIASLPIEEPWKLRLQEALTSTSASERLRAIRAINTGEMDKVTSFDVPHEMQEIVTEEERRKAEEANTVTIAEVMAGVCVYVEVRSEREDRSESIKAVLRRLGIKVNDKFYRNTTHVVFKDGLMSTYTKAKKWNIPIVSILWIEACRQCLIVVDPERFRPNDLERYEQPDLYKIKRHKFIRCEAESPHRIASKSLVVNPPSPAVATPKVLSKTTTGETLCDTPETKFINNILVAPARGQKTEDAANVKTQTLDDSSIDSLGSGKKTQSISTEAHAMTPRRSARRASTGISSSQDGGTPFKSLRKSLSMELTFPDSQNSHRAAPGKLENIEEGDEMDLEVPEKRTTILTMESMIESPQATNGVVQKPPSRWTEVNGESTMEVIEDATITPNKLIFSSTATPGSSRRATLFHHRIQMLNNSAKAEKTTMKAPVREFEDLLTKTPKDVVENTKSRRRTLCPLPTVETFPELSRKDDKEKLESQPKRRKLFHHSTAVVEEPPVLPEKTPKKPTERRKTMGPIKAPPPSVVPKKDDKRRSTLEFEVDTAVVKPPKEDEKNKKKKEDPTIVITNIYGKDKNFVEEAVKKLGYFRMERTVTRATTHLVTLNNPSRTLNMMRALIRGVWIVNLDWIKASVAAAKWLPEEPYEMHKFAPAVRLNRTERQLLGNSFKMDLLRDTMPIYVSPRCSVPLKEMQELIVLCGGRVATKAQAKLILGAKGTQCPNGTTCVTSSWILESILARRVLPTTPYVVQQ
ncbi:mediator of DNA damage checkpoint protein 1 [Lutzomyia longipalpis]|nr:mediator of DNA damage checkpoint protein 1 [Lutzomyia longipalpis]